MRQAHSSKAAVDGPGLQRTIALTDAVVAIAMTLLVLPLVEQAGEVDSAHLGSWLGGHRDLMLSFAISFMVIYVFWAAHAGALRRAEVAGVEVPGLRPLNLWWLMVIAFLPFPTAVVGRDLNTVSAPTYIGTMLVLSGLTSTIINLVDRAAGPPRRGGWAWVTTGVFAVCTALSIVNAELGVFALLSLALVRLFDKRMLRRGSGDQATDDRTPTGSRRGGEGAST